MPSVSIFRYMQHQLAEKTGDTNPVLVLVMQCSNRAQLRGLSSDGQRRQGDAIPVRGEMPGFGNASVAQKVFILRDSCLDK